ASALGKTPQAEEDFRRAIDILAAVKHEVELARAYQGLAAIKERAGATAEAQKLRGRAIDIFTRLRGAAAPEGAGGSRAALAPGSDDTASNTVVVLLRCDVANFDRVALDAVELVGVWSNQTR